MKKMNLLALVLDQKLQSRVAIDEETVQDYAEAIQNGEEFPPVLVYFDGVNYYLTDGYHRYHAHKRAEKATILCDVVNGTFRDAVLHATSVNSKHGMRRTTADKRKAVATLLDDFEWSTWSNAEIAKQCGVSAPFVASIRNATGKQVEEIKYKTKTGEVAVKAKASGRPKQEPEPEPVVDQDDQTQEAIDMLVAENEQLKDRLALAAMDATEEEKVMAQQTIDGLREEIRIMQIELVAVKASRDTYQKENAQLKSQIKSLMRKLKASGVE